MAPLAIVAALGAVFLAGTKTGTALALLAVLGPVAGYVALTSPLLFPFCLYVIAIPFDNLLNISSFGTVTKLLGGACGAAVVLWLIRSRRYVIPDKAALAWLVFVLFATASTAWAINAGDTALRLATLSELFILYAALVFFPVEAKQLRTVIQAVILSGTAAAAYGAYLFEHGVDIASSGRLFIGVTSVANVGNHIDPNQFAASLLLPIGLAIVTVVEARRVATKLAASTCLLIMGAGIAFAGSRGSIVAIGCMFVYLLFRSRKKLLLGSVVCAALGVALVSYNRVLERFAEAPSTGGAGRLDIWHVGALAFLRHPIFGAGFGNFPDAYNQAYVWAGVTQNLYWGQDPHSNIVSVAVELGVVGLGIFVYATWAQFRCLRFIGRSSSLYPLRNALEAGMIGIFVASLFLSTIPFKYYWLVFIIVMLSRNAALITVRDETKATVAEPQRTLVARRASA